MQTSGSTLTFVTAASPEAAAAALEQQQKNLQQQGQRQQTDAAVGSSSSTIHHLAISSPANPISNLNQNISLTANMSESQPLPTVAGLKRPQNASGTVLLTTALPKSPTPSSTTSVSISPTDLKLFTLTQQSVVPSDVSSSVGVTSSDGPSPKKIKLEEKPASNKETENYRQHVCSSKKRKMREIKLQYREHLTELFYLQGGGNIIEFHIWKKRPTQPLLSFLEDSRLDSDDDSDELQEMRINDEVTCFCFFLNVDEVFQLWQ